MLDLHCHILPGVDDGAASFGEALAMARFCVKDGITHVVATPHCHRHCRMLRADVLPHVALLNEELANAGIRLVILPGSEIQVTDTAAYRREFEAGLYCHLGDSHTFTLLELPWNGKSYPPDAAELVGWLRSQGMTPILAHPERHRYFTDDPGRLRALVDAGAWLQITVDSLLGNHGPDPATSSEELLHTYPDAVLATDAHNLRRCSGLSAGYTWVREGLGAERAEELLARMNQVLVGLSRADDPAVADATHDNGAAAEMGLVALLDGGVGIHVYMDDFRVGIHCNDRPRASGPSRSSFYAQRSG